MKRILLTGQSTAGGIGGGGPDFTGVNSLVDVWNNAASISGGVGSSYITPVRGSDPFRSGDNNNVGVWFCDHYADFYNEAVQYTLIYKDGEAITFWANGQEMDNRMDAVFAAQGSVKWDIILWMQGEADAFAGQESQYVSRFTTMRNLWLSNGFMDVNTPIFVNSLGQLTDYDEMNDSIFPSLEAIDNVHYIDNEDLATADGTHWTASAMLTIAQRNFDAYQLYYPAAPVIEYTSRRQTGPRLAGSMSVFC